MPHSFSALRRFAPLRALVAFAAAGACASCTPPNSEPPPVPDLRVAQPETHYVATEGAKTMFFATHVANHTDSAMVVTAFAYATDDVAQPPARALYPPRAFATMPGGRFAMGRPDLGQRLVLAPRDSAAFEGALPVPRTWVTGQPITTTGFRDLTVYLYGADGKTLFRQQWTLRRIRGDAR